MVFSSVNFLFLFLPALLVVYFIVPKSARQLRNAVLLAASLFFYGYGGPKFLPVMLLSIGLNYCFGRFVDWSVDPNRKKCYVILAVLCNIGLLAYFKYTIFFLSNFNALFQTDFAIPNIVLPIGISFFTFQGLSYVLDVYWGESKVQKNFLNVALYISLFPQLIAGPIVRYTTVEEEIMYREESLSDFSAGITRFMLGFAKKIILANTMGAIADQIFQWQPSQMSLALCWLGVISYGLQIYFDFSGYSDMAIGLGKLFGFHFLENFNYPYISQSVSEFWRRWHISLGSWFRDYVYIPLGGNRCAKWRGVANIAIVWLLTGFWHGADWNFLLWGAYFAALLLLEKFVLAKLLRKFPRWFRHGYTLMMIMISWALFRSPTIDYCLSFLGTMFGFGGTGLWDSPFLFFIKEYKVELLLAGLACLPIAPTLKTFFKNKAKTQPPLVNLLLTYGESCYIFGVFGLALLYLINVSFNPFIYFRF